MFYCDRCADRNEWPSGPRSTQSWGRCEVCNMTTGCNDVPSSHLPDPAELQVIDSIKQTIEKRSSSAQP